MFIVRPANLTAGGRDRLAANLAQRFHLDEKIVRKYLKSGRRIRVRGGISAGEARELAGELEGLGAVVAVEKNPPQVTGSGLSAAVPDATDEKVLEVLAHIESLTVSSLDGELIDAAPVAEVEPPPPPEPPKARVRPSSGPARPVDALPRLSRAGRPAHLAGEVTPPEIEFRVPSGNTEPVPRDPFAPPEEAGEIEMAYPPPRRASAIGSGPHVARPPDPPPPLTSPVSVPAAPERASFPRRVATALATDARARFGTVVAVGLVAGFAPAHIYAAMAEDKLDEMRVELLREPPATSDASYDLLIERYAATRARMARTKARIEIATALVWILGSCGVGYGLWRVLPSPKASRS